MLTPYFRFLFRSFRKASLIPVSYEPWFPALTVQYFLPLTWEPLGKCFGLACPWGFRIHHWPHVVGREGSVHPGLALPPTAPSIPQFEMLNAELEENQELANSRMAELEKLQAELQGAVRTNERLKVGSI